MKKFHQYSIVLGIILLGFLIWKIGPVELVRELRTVGFGLVTLILLEGLVQLFHSIGWRHCLTGSSRSLPILHVFRVYMAGNSINYLTPLAGLGGEVTKGTLLSLNHHGSEAASGVMIGKVAFALAHLLYVVAGSALIYREIDLGAGIWGAMLTGSLLVGSGIIGFLIIQKKGKLGAVLRWMMLHRIGRNKLEKLALQMNEVDSAMQVFYRDQKWDFPLAVAWHSAGQVIGILQNWYFLYLLTGDTSILMPAAISFIGNWIDLVGFAIPSDIGVLEGTRVLVFKILGFSSTMGLTYGVTLRLLQIFWALAGLLIYGTLVFENGGRWFKRVQ